MNYVEKVLDGVHSALNLNAATLSGAIDTVVVPQEDGTLQSTPFHVRFGKLQLLNSSEKYISIHVNDQLVDLKMKLGVAGEAFFVEETDDSVPPSLVTSPIGSPPSTPGPMRKASIPETPQEMQRTLTSKLEELLQQSKTQGAAASVTASATSDTAAASVTMTASAVKPSSSSPSGTVTPAITTPSSPSSPASPTSIASPPSEISPKLSPKEVESANGSPSSDPIPIRVNRPRVRTESFVIKDDVSDSELPFAFDESPPANDHFPKIEETNSGEVPEMSWGWGSLPRVKSKYPRTSVLNMNTAEVKAKKVTPSQTQEAVEVTSSQFTKEEDKGEVSSSWTGKVGSLFRIFKGSNSDPKYIVRSTSELTGPTTEYLTDVEKELPPLKEADEIALEAKSDSEANLEAIVNRQERRRGEKETEEMSENEKEEKEMEEEEKQNGEKEEKGKPKDEKKTKGNEEKDEKEGKEENEESEKETEDEDSLTASQEDGWFASDPILKSGADKSTKEGEDKPNDFPPLYNDEEENFPPEEPREGKVLEDEVLSELPHPLRHLNLKMSKCGNMIGMDSLESMSREEVDRIFEEHVISFDDFDAKPEVLFDPNLVLKLNDKIYPYAIAAPILMSLLAFGEPLRLETVDKLEEKVRQQVKSQQRGWGAWLWRTKPTTPKDPKSPDDGTNDKAIVPVKKLNVRKSLRPTSEQLKSLNLKPGANSIRFTVSSTLQGTREVRASVYLWHKDIKIVISDIDGTITRSDVFGQILPIIGRDWSHSGVAQLYGNIARNNYQLLYLTARPIGQANITRGYISGLKQGDLQLPPGPVFMSPSRLLTSFNREIILRRPEEFKIACLKDIKALFPKECQPFYAGFGNRPSDALSYRAVGVPLGKIFTINYAGEINTVNYTYKKTFSNLNELVNAMFPGKNTTDEEWNHWNFWKTPYPDLNNTEEDTSLV